MPYGEISPQDAVHLQGDAAPIRVTEQLGSWGTRSLLPEMRLMHFESEGPAQHQGFLAEFDSKISVELRPDRVSLHVILSNISTKDVLASGPVTAQEVHQIPLCCIGPSLCEWIDKRNVL